MYDELYIAWKSEKTSDRPQPLPSDFYQRMVGYLKGLEDDSASSDTRTIQGRLVAREKEIAKRLLEELKEARLRKIVNATRNGGAINSADLTEEEKTLVGSINESLASFKEQDKEELQRPTTEGPVELSIVRFLQDVPEIVGVDLKIYGPYKKEDVGSLPSQNAQALVKQGFAKTIEVKGISNRSLEK